MPRTRSRISLSAALASSWAAATSSAPGLGVVVELLAGRARGRRPARPGAAGRRRGGRARCAAARPRRCRRPPCGSSRSSVTCAASSLVVGRPEQRASASASCRRPAPIVIHGATNTSPTTPTASASQRAGSAASISKKQNLARVAGQRVDVGGQQRHRQRAAPRRRRQREAEHGAPGSCDAGGGRSPSSGRRERSRSPEAPEPRRPRSSGGTGSAIAHAASARRPGTARPCRAPGTA